MNLIIMPNTITLSALNKCQEYLYGNIIEKGDYLRLYVERVIRNALQYY